MSFWSKKTDEQSQVISSTIEQFRETLSELEIRVSTNENSFTKRDQELKASIERVDEFVQKKVDNLQHQILSVTDFIPTAFKEYQKLLEDLQRKQCILEERIAVYDEKLEKLKELTDRLEEQSKKPVVSNNSLTGYKPSPITRVFAEQNNVPRGPVSPTGPPPKVVISGTKQPSWIKKKEEPSPTINDTVVRDA